MNLLKLTSGVWLWYAVAAFIAIADQLTKSWASAALDLHETYTISSFFNFTLRHNYGAAFSIFADGSGWQRWFLGILAAAVSVLLIVWIARLEKKNWLEACALALVLGGAVGNLYDRVLLGYVVDFIVVHYEYHAWPAFNIADSAICVGAVLLIYDAIFVKKNDVQKSVNNDG